MKNIHRVVFTGGPAAGKTTLLARALKVFEGLGYRVIIVPETATDLITGFGIKPFGNCVSMVEFQDFVLSYQLEKEKLAEKAAQMVPEDNVLIIYDRGLLDNKAYVLQEEFEAIIKRFNLSEIQAMDRYDAVIYLLSSANGAEQFYSLDNAARTESISEARELDNKTIKAWLGHNHIRIIDNSVDFEQKINNAMSEIFAVVGIPSPIEIKERYLIEIPDLEALKARHGAIESRITQHYLLENERGTERRIRQRSINGADSYFYTEKKKLAGQNDRVVTERVITNKQFLDYLSEKDKNILPLSKTRYMFRYNDLYLKLDVYPFENYKAILEIELSDRAKKVTFPPEIKMIETVTFDPRYFNYEIAKRKSI